MLRQTLKMHQTGVEEQINADVLTATDCGPAWANGPIELKVTVGAARVDTAMMQTQVSPAVRIAAWGTGRPPLVK